MSRICLLVHSLDEKRGGGRMALGLIEGLEAEGHSIHTLTARSENVPPQDVLVVTRPLKLLANLPKIRAAIRECDIVQTFDPLPYGLVGWLAGLGLGKPLIIIAVGSGAVRPLYYRGAPLARFAYRRADRVTSISGYVAREIHKKMPDLPVEPIPNGIDYDHFVHQPIAPLSPGRPYVLSVAKVKPRKGVAIALRAFAQIAPDFPELDYINVGVCEGPYAQEVKRLVHELGIEDRVIFEEMIEDQNLRALYQHALLFILLPKDDDHDIEGFGLVYVEAAAFGLPVIGARDSGAEDAMEDGTNGYLVAPEDADAAARRMRAILADPALRERLSEASVDFAKRRDWKNVAKRYSALYRSL